MADFSRCSRCAKFQPVALFHLQRNGVNGQPVLNAWCKPCRRVYALQRRQRIRDEVIAAYGGACACCGETTKWFLAVDHVRGGGNRHRKEMGFKGSTALYEWLRKMGFPKDDFRLLCWNCNAARGVYGFCPHTTEEAPLAAR